MCGGGSNPGSAPYSQGTLLQPEPQFPLITTPPAPRDGMRCGTKAASTEPGGWHAVAQSLQLGVTAAPSFPPPGCGFPFFHICGFKSLSHPPSHSVLPTWQVMPSMPPHFAEGETEAQKGYMTWPESPPSLRG